MEVESKTLLGIADNALPPQEAAINIKNAKTLDLDPDAYTDSKESLAPIAQNADIPEKISRNVASTVGTSQQRIALAKNDLGKLNAFDKFTRHFGESTEQRSMNRELNHLANKKRRQKGVLSEDDDLKLEVLRSNMQKSADITESADYSWFEKLPSTVYNVAADMIDGTWEQKNYVAAGSVLGAAAGTPGFLGGPIPGLVTTGLGAVKGAVLGAGAAQFKDGYEMSSGQTYEGLDTAVGENGKPLNISEDEKDNIATGVGALTAAIDGASSIFVALKSFPALKKLIKPGAIIEQIAKEEAGQVATGTMRASLGKIGKFLTESGLAEGGTEGIQEVISIIAEELGQTWDGNGTSLNTAFENIAEKISSGKVVNKETGQTYLSAQAARIAEATATGAVAGAAIQIAGKPINSAVEKGVGAAAKKLGIVKPPAEVATESTLPVEPEVTRRTDIVPKSNLPMVLTGARSMQLEIAILEGNRRLGESDIAKYSPEEDREIRRQILEQNGIKYGWLSQDDLDIENMAPDKRAKAMKLLDPSGAMGENLNGPLRVEIADMMELEKEIPGVAKHIRSEPEAMSADQYVQHMETKKAKAAEIMATASRKTPQESAYALNLTPDMDDATIATTLLDQETADAYLGRLEVNEMVEGTNPEQMAAIAKMRERVTAIRETLPDVVTPESTVKKALEAEALDTTVGNEEDYLTQPLMTKEMMAGIPDKELQAFNAVEMGLREELADNVLEGAQKEMLQVLDLQTRQAIEAEREQLMSEIENDPNIKIVDQFVAQIDVLAIDPGSLTPKQRGRYSQDATIKARKALKKGGANVDAVARELNLPNGETLLRILSRTSTREETANIMLEQRRAIVEQQAVDTTDFNDTATVKSFEKLSSNQLKTARLMLDRHWSQFKKGIKRISYGRLDVNQIRAQARDAIQNTKVRDLNVNQYKMGEVRSSKKAVDFALKNDFLNASHFKVTAALNTELAKNTQIAIGKVNRYFKNMARFSEQSIINEIKKAGPVYENAVNELKDIFNLDPRNSGQSKRDSYSKFVKEMKKKGQGDFTIPQSMIDSLESRTDPRDMTVDEVKFLSDSLTSILHMARSKNKLMNSYTRRVQGNAVAKIVKEASAKLRAHPDFDPKRGDRPQGNVDESQKVGTWLARGESMLDNILYLNIRADGGKRGGHITKLFYDVLTGSGFSKGLGNGTNATDDLRNVIKTHFAKAIDKYGAMEFGNLANKQITIPEFAKLQRLNNGNMTRYDLFVLGAYYGSPNGRKRLANFGVGADVIFEVLQRELGTKGFDVLQEGVWNQMKGLQPRIAAVEKITKGIDVDFVEGAGFTVTDPKTGATKEFAGGYFPLTYRKAGDAKEVATKVGRELDRAAGLIEGEYEGRQASVAATRQGYLIAQLENVDQVLDISHHLIPKAFEDIIVDVTMRVPLMDTMKLLKDETLSADFIAVLGPEGYTSLVNHTMDLAQSNHSKNLEIYGDQVAWVNSISSHLRRNFAAGQIALNPSSILMQPVSMMTNWNSLGYVKGTKHFAKTLAKMLTRPHLAPAMARLAAEINPNLMANINDVSDAELGGIGDLNPKQYSKMWRPFPQRLLRRTLDAIVNKLAFKILLGTVDYHMKVAATLVAYQQFRAGEAPGWTKQDVLSMSDTEQHLQALSFASSNNQSTLTSAGRAERAAVQKKYPLLSMFFNDARNSINHYFQSHREIGWNAKGVVKDLREGNFTKASAKANDVGTQYMSLLMMTAASLTMTAWARGADVVRDEEEEKEERKSIMTAEGAEQLAFTFVTALTSPETVLKMYTDSIAGSIPVVRNVIFALNGYLRKGDKLIATDVSTVIQSEVATVGDVLAQWATTEEGEEFEMSDQQFESVLKATSYLTIPFPANGVIKAKKALTADEEDRPINEPSPIEKALEFFNGFISQFSSDERPEMQEMVADAKETVKNIAPQVSLPAVGTLVAQVLRGDPPPVDRAVYEWIRYQESTMDDDAVPLKWEKDSDGNLKKDENGKKIPVWKRDKKGKVVRDALGNKVQDTLSSAYGRYQFIDRTWNEINVETGGKLGLTDKTDPEQQERAMDFLVRQHAAAFQKRGIEPTPGNIYAAHYMGLRTALKVLDEDNPGSTRLKSLMTEREYDEFIEGNPWFKKGVRVGEIRRFMNRKMSEARKKYENYVMANLD